MSRDIISMRFNINDLYHWCHPMLPRCCGVASKFEFAVDIFRVLRKGLLTSCSICVQSLSDMFVHMVL